jgi:hypothetical protein
MHLGTRPPSERFTDFMVPLGGVRRAVALPGSWEWLDTAIRDAHSWQSFQQPDKIAEVVRLVSDVKLWPNVASLLGKDAGAVKSELKVIVDRRNKIVHEADSDPTNPEFRWPIDSTMTDRAVGTVESIALAIYDSIS